MEILGVVDVPATWILIIGCLLLIYLYGKKRNQFFKNNGIPGPEPIVYIGNFHQIISRGVRLDDDYRDKYGDVYGIFVGGVPMITVYDTDMIRDILIKDFNNFSDRFDLHLDDFPINEGMFFQTGADWSRIRHISSPTFSAAKLRMMCDRISNCSRALTDNLLAAADKKQEINVKDYFGGFTMDVIASTAFGIDVDSQNDLDNQLMTEAKRVFADAGIGSPLTMLVFILPELRPMFKAIGFSQFPKKSVRYFHKILTQMIEERKSDAKKGVKYNDFLQMLMDTETDGNFGDVISQEKESKKMTLAEILGQALLFFVAGYETTANTLHFAAYSLATNPDVQEKAFKEIELVLGNDEPNYDNIGELKYLDHIVTETLRMYPVVPMLNREVQKTVTMKGFTFQKGALVGVPSLMIHRDPKLYEEPNKFNPDRWLKKAENDVLNYLPFGHGPRHCLGMRLAQVEMRIALAHVIKNIRFLPGKDTPPCLKNKDLNITAVLCSKKPILLVSEQR